MFRKNTSGQFIHIQGVDASTGGIKSGVTWTVRRCIDGTFAAATGTATEDSTNGWYKFAMSQADTNGNDVGFNFTGTGAVPQTVNIVTTAADPTDAAAFGLSRIDAAISSRMATATLPGLGADNKVLVSTDVQDLSATLSINAKKIGATTQTGRDLGLSVLLSSGTGTGQLDFTSGVVKSNLVQILATALTETAGLLAGGFKKFFNVASPTLTCLGVDQTGDTFAQLPTRFSSLAIDASGRLDISKVLGSTLNALISGRLDVNAQALATAVIASGSFAAGAIDSAAMAASAENAIADALLDRSAAIETGLTVRGALRLCASALAGVLSGAATTTVTINNAVANAKARITATVDANGNRSAVSTDVT